MAICNGLLYAVLASRALCSSVIILLGAGLGTTIFALSFMMTSVTLVCSASQSVYKQLVSESESEYIYNPQDQLGSPWGAALLMELGGYRNEVGQMAYTG